jgi:adenylate cyclase
VTREPSVAEDAGAIPRWLMDHPHDGDGGAAFMRAFAARLGEAGVPLWRASYALMTMHPEVLWRTVQWRAGEDVVVRDQPHERLHDAFYKASPVAFVRTSLAPARVRLVAGDLPFPICVDLRAAGGTDYYVQPLPFTSGATSYVSFATAAPGGFSDATLDLLEAIQPFLARRLELESAYHATRALLEVYLGRNASRRVLAGAFQRGRGELLDAAIWFSDMRNFTALSDRTPPAQVVQILDAHFDAIATAVSTHGGEVLKFIGDAVLAIFPIEDDARRACRAALAAAEQALSSLARVNEGRAAPGEEPVAIGIALHRGLVMYGNIGARDRLDFTVISSAVNEASRLESLCKTLDTPLALSASFAEAAAVDDLVDLGEHALKGVSAPVRVLTLRGVGRGARGLSGAG